MYWKDIFISIEKNQKERKANTGFCVRRGDMQTWCFVLIDCLALQKTPERKAQNRYHTYKKNTATSIMSN